MHTHLIFFALVLSLSVCSNADRLILPKKVVLLSFLSIPYILLNAQITTVFYIFSISYVSHENECTNFF